MFYGQWKSIYSSINVYLKDRYGKDHNNEISELSQDQQQIGDF